MAYRKEANKVKGINTLYLGGENCGFNASDLLQSYYNLHHLQKKIFFNESKREGMVEHF